MMNELRGTNKNQINKSGLAASKQFYEDWIRYSNNIYDATGAE